MEESNLSKTAAGKIVLLIEDDPLLVNMYRSKFENEGFNLLVAENGEEGLGLALKENVDIIILDIMLPKISGTDMLAQLRKSSKGKKIPVIVLTNLTEEGEARKALRLGAKEYLTKATLTPTQIVGKIKEHLGLK